MSTLPPTPASTYIMGSSLSKLSIDYYDHFSYKFSIELSSDDEEIETDLHILSSIGAPTVTISSGSDTD